MLTINGRGEAGQDHFAFEHCNHKADGTFLDIGSNEPIRWNNTYALEEVGWRGLLIDIEESYGPMCVGVRKSPFYAADAITFDYRAFFKGWRTPIDYLSLDIDENEQRDRATTILSNLMVAGLTFRCATIEHDAYRYGDNPRAKIRDLMTYAGYTLAHANVEIRKGNGKPFEDWWIRRPQ